MCGPRSKRNVGRRAFSTRRSNNRRKKYGGSRHFELRWLRQLEAENSKLERLEAPHGGIIICGAAGCMEAGSYALHAGCPYKPARISRRVATVTQLDRPRGLKPWASAASTAKSGRDRQAVFGQYARKRPLRWAQSILSSSPHSAASFKRLNDSSLVRSANGEGLTMPSGLTTKLSPASNGNWGRLGVDPPRDLNVLVTPL
jgi:hypothetical protein